MLGMEPRSARTPPPAFPFLRFNCQKAPSQRYQLPGQIGCPTRRRQYETASGPPLRASRRFERYHRPAIATTSLAGQGGIKTIEPPLSTLFAINSSSTAYFLPSRLKRKDSFFGRQWEPPPGSRVNRRARLSPTAPNPIRGPSGQAAAMPPQLGLQTDADAVATVRHGSRKSLARRPFDQGLGIALTQDRASARGDDFQE